jgi:heptosyltransferase-2/heptosyltransferase-3
MPILERAGIPNRCIVDVKDHALLPGEHATQQWRRLAQIMPAALASAPHPDIEAVIPGCYLQVTPAQRSQLDTWLMARGIGDQPLILMQIGNKRTMRRGPRRLAVNNKFWPNERWAEVLRFLRQRHPGHAIALLGTGPEFALNQELAALAAISGLHNVADDLPIPRLVALLDRAAGLVTVDSGPAHAAAAVGCPQVVLFGRALPSLYRPRGIAGADVRLLTGQIDGQQSMLGIDASSVIAAWSGLTLRRA